MDIERKLAELGLELPDIESMYRSNPTGARFHSHLAHGNVLYTSGSVAIRGGTRYMTGVLGADLSIEQGYEAARFAALHSLGIVKFALGDLDRVDQALQLVGYVNSAPRFSDQPRVINGATDVLVELYGARGMPTRAAIGCAGLAANNSVEIILTLAFSGSDVRAPLTREQIAAGA